MKLRIPEHEPTSISWFMSLVGAERCSSDGKKNSKQPTACLGDVWIKGLKIWERYKKQARWWFQTVFYFHPYLGRSNLRSICFKWVGSTTN